MKTLYAITYINKDGMRTLAFANQGVNHFETEEKANRFLSAVNENGSLSRVLKTGGDTLEVRPVQCYDHGDAISVWFDEK